MIPSIIQMATTTVSLITFCILGVTGAVTGVSDYNGVVVFETDMQFGISVGGMILSHDYFVPHEYGHILQQEELGIMYFPIIAIPSIINAARLSLGGITYNQYMNSYTETWANQLGGVHW